MVTNSIGFGAAEILLEAGARVVVISSSEERVQEAVKRLRESLSDPDTDRVEGRVGNVRDEPATVDLLLSLAPLDHLIFSSVDKIIRGPFADADLDEAKYLFGVKFWGSIVVAKAVAKHPIVKPGGSLTLTSGGAALRPRRGAALGSALNGGLITITQALADELADKKVRVNTVVPGLVVTELWDKLGHSEEKKAEIFDQSAKELSVGFVATPEHIAEAYLYAVRADYANGSTIVIGMFFSDCRGV